MHFKSIAVAASAAFFLRGVQSFNIYPRARVNSLASRSGSGLRITPLQTERLYHRNFHLRETPVAEYTEIDSEAIGKYSLSLVTQISLIAAVFFALDSTLASSGNTLPTAITWFICYAFSLKSRIFNPLNNSRPDRKKAIENGESDGFMDRKQPSWTPPGVVFPIMWILIIGPLRATSSTIVIESLGSYLNLPVMSLMLHLSCGDIWNTINNTEKRYGTAVLGILTVFITALHAAWRYYQVDALAGELLGATTIWLAIAGTLIFEIWRLNPNELGEKDSFLPTKVIGKDSVTALSWGMKDENQVA